MLPAEAEARVKELEDRLAAIRGIVAATADAELRTILGEMLADGDRALALLNAESKRPLQ